jgi:hypothetical protein
MMATNEQTDSSIEKKATMKEGKHMYTNKSTRRVTYRANAIAAGVFYLITHVTSIGAVILYAPILSNAKYIIGPGADMQIMLGAFFEIILAFGNIGTSVALFPIVKKQNEGIAIGYVGLRTLESGIIAIGIIPMVTIVTLRLMGGADPATLVTLGRGLVAFHNWTFLFGPSFTSGTNTVLMAYLMYRSRLVPRFIPILGLIGGPLVFASAAGVLFGLFGQYSPVAFLPALPEFAWELSLAIWLIVRGFNPMVIAGWFGKAEVSEPVSAM